MNILPEDDGSYTATCERHPYWHFNGAEKIREKIDKAPTDAWLIKRMGSEARARAALRLHVRLWQCASMSDLKDAIAKMRTKPNVKVV